LPIFGTKFLIKKTNVPIFGTKFLIKKTNVPIFGTKFLIIKWKTQTEPQRLRLDFETSQATEDICARFKNRLVLKIKLSETNISVNNFKMKERKLHLLHLLELERFSLYVILVKMLAELNKRTSVFCELRYRFRFFITGSSYGNARTGRGGHINHG